MKGEHTYDSPGPAEALFGAWSGPAVGLLDLVCGVMGARLSKTPAKLKPFVWAACAVCVVNIVTIIRSVAENSLDLVWVNALYAATAFAAIVYASRALKAAGDN